MDIAALERLIFSLEREVLFQLLKNPDFPAHEFIDHFDTDFEALGYIALNPTLEFPELLYLYNLGWEEISIKALQNQNKKLLTDGKVVDHALAFYPHGLANAPINEDIQNSLIDYYLNQQLNDDNAKWIMFCLASNDHCTDKTLRQLWNLSKNGLRIKEAILTNPALKPDTMVEWYEKGEIEELKNIFFLLKNPNTPTELINQIYRNREKFFTCTGGLSQQGRDFLTLIGSHLKTPLYILQELTNSTYNQIRGGVAKNPNLPEKEKQQLLEDLSPGVRCSLASNPALSLELQMKLSLDLTPFVREQLAKNDKTCKSILIEMFSNKEEEKKVRQLAGVTLRKILKQD